VALRGLSVASVERWWSSLTYCLSPRRWGLAFDDEVRGRRGFAAVWLERGQQLDV
jgi:hypothetical protein